MKKLLDLLNRITPETAALLKQRYDILSSIHSFQPIGRRTLSYKLAKNERGMRRELDFLRKLDLIEAKLDGVYLTEKGEALLLEMQPYVREALGLTFLEERLTARLGLTKIIIVPGDSDSDDVAAFDMGRAAAQLIKDNLRHDSIIAVTGGWTLARVTQMARGYFPGITVVPARGGLGEKVEIQANTVAARLAENLGGRYRLLHIPENLDPTALKALLADSRIQEVITFSRKADILLYGVGRADTMAKRRGLSLAHTDQLLAKGAVAEALGHYFNERGEVVASVPSLGLDVADMPHLSLAIAVAGGQSKAEALGAALQKSRHLVLVTDESAARSMLDKFSEDDRK